jgi:hypothetical protein
LGRQSSALFAFAEPQPHRVGERVVGLRANTRLERGVFPVSVEGQRRAAADLDREHRESRDESGGEFRCEPRQRNHCDHINLAVALCNGWAEKKYRYFVGSLFLLSYAGISLTSVGTRSTVTVQESRKPPGVSKMDGSTFGVNGRTRNFRFRLTFCLCSDSRSKSAYLLIVPRGTTPFTRRGSMVRIH